LDDDNTVYLGLSRKNGRRGNPVLWGLAMLLSLWRSGEKIGGRRFWELGEEGGE
jgi:hypothetical protein